MSAKYIIGIDEAGRGPVAGPISVGAVCVAVSVVIEHELFAKGIKDSKKLTPKRRNVLFDWIHQNDNLRQGVGLIGSDVIDAQGIVPATRLAMESAIEQVLPGGCSMDDITVLLDGGLYAPEVFKNQETIVKGDEKEVVIALASVMAKVSRDREMERLGLKYPEYGFEGHKGYGTKAHYAAIRENGMCKEHRRSFLTRFL
ncbi:ribonuclease HII [Candidatus Kaiserbacteria bacterium]|nr:MAG: ribonuclease HII [Candidatus Kaiserbacteria bacterium]